MAGVYTSLDWDNLPGGVKSTAPNGVRRGARAGRGWTGSKAETQGGPGRLGAGPRCKMYGWKFINEIGGAHWCTLCTLSRSMGMVYTVCTAGLHAPQI